MARIELDGVTRVAGGKRVLDRVTFEVADGEFVTLIGASGAGKTSVLRAIAGLDEITAGTIRFDGRDMASVPTAERNIGMVSQHNTLFPNHRVRTNLMLPLIYRIMPRSEARKRVEAESRAHSIEHILDRWPASLAGGEQQLAQIARALVRVPQVFLMDEPLAKLDIRVRHRLRREIVELQQGYRVTTVYTSNRSDEILAMADRVVALDHGRVIQVGPPHDVRARPRTLTIAVLTGELSQLAVTVEADRDGYWIVGDGIRVRAWAPVLGDHLGPRLTLATRPEHVRLVSGGNLQARVGGPTFVDSRPATELETGAGRLVTLAEGLERGSEISAMLDAWLLFDRAGRLVLASPS